MSARPSRSAHRPSSIARPRRACSTPLRTNLYELVHEANALTDDDEEAVDLICAILQDHRAYTEGKRLVVRTDLDEAEAVAALAALDALDNDDNDHVSSRAADLAALSAFEEQLPGA